MASELNVDCELKRCASVNVVWHMSVVIHVWPRALHQGLAETGALTVKGTGIPHKLTN